MNIKKRTDEDKIKFYYSKMLAKINRSHILVFPSLYKSLLLIIIISFIIVLLFNIFSNIIKSNSDASYKYNSYPKKTSDTFNEVIEKVTDSNFKNNKSSNDNFSTDLEKSASPKPTDTNYSMENESISESDSTFENLGDNTIKNNLESIIGLEKDNIEKIFGEPDRIDISENSFNWYIYNKDYSKYIMLGILDDNCVCFYTNNNFHSIFSDISPGKSVNELEKMGLSINESNRTIWNAENINFTVFHNPKEHNNILGIYGVSDILSEETFISNNDYSDTKYIESVKLQIFDLINSYKYSNSFNIYKWNDSYIDIAEKMFSLKNEGDESNQEYLKEELLKLDSNGFMTLYDEQNSIFLFEKIFQNSQVDLNSNSHQYLVPQIKYNEKTDILNLILLFIDSNS